MRTHTRVVHASTQAQIHHKTDRTLRKGDHTCFISDGNAFSVVICDMLLGSARNGIVMLCDTLPNHDV